MEWWSGGVVEWWSGGREKSLESRGLLSDMLLAPPSTYFKDHGRHQISVDYKFPDIPLYIFVDWLRQGKAQHCSSMRGDQADIPQFTHEFPRHRKADFRQDAIV